MATASSPRRPFPLVANDSFSDVPALMSRLAPDVRRPIVLGSIPEPHSVIPCSDSLLAHPVRFAEGKSDTPRVVHAAKRRKTAPTFRSPGVESGKAASVRGPRVNTSARANANTPPDRKENAASVETRRPPRRAASVISRAKSAVVVISDVEVGAKGSRMKTRSRRKTVVKSEDEREDRDYECNEVAECDDDDDEGDDDYIDDL